MQEPVADPVADRGRDVRRSPAVRRLLHEIEHRLAQADQPARWQSYERWQADEQWRAYDQASTASLVTRGTFQPGVPRSRNP